MEAHYTAALAGYLSNSDMAAAKIRMKSFIWSEYYRSGPPTCSVSTVADLSPYHPTWQQHKQPPLFSLAGLALISGSVCRRRFPPPFTAISCWCWQSFLMLDVPPQICLCCLCLAELLAAPAAVCPCFFSWTERNSGGIHRGNTLTVGNRWR